MNGSHGERVRPLTLGSLGVVLIDKLSCRPSFADDELFEVEVERRFLLWYKCIRRTKPVTIDQVRTGNRECPVIYTTPRALRDLGFVCLQIVRCRCTMGNSLQKCLKTGLRLAKSRLRFGIMQLVKTHHSMAKPALRLRHTYRWLESRTTSTQRVRITAEGLSPRDP